jgi:16S rRNA (cytosine967-C5)-methyltransferase
LSNNPRRVALSVINDVLNNDAYANIALNEKIKSENLTELDKKLVTQLVYGTISKKITLDWYTKPYVKKAKKWVKNLLAMTVYQIIYMDRIPTSAAVDEAVKIAKSKVINVYQVLSMACSAILRALSFALSTKFQIQLKS